MANIIRIFIVLASFILGVLVGNIYLPERNFDKQDIVALPDPVSTLKLNSSYDIEVLLLKIDDIKNILATCGQSQEVQFDFENTFKRALLLSSFKEVASKYALELLRAQQATNIQVDFLNSKNNYQKVVALIEKTYPIKTPQEVIIIKEESANNVSAETENKDIKNVEDTQEVLKEVSSANSATNPDEIQQEGNEIKEQQAVKNIDDKNKEIKK